ncbi:MAG: UDP-GlcNAc3NAcA epimerase [Arcticibacterium sp.]|jgi:UDP-GlcNAc3NAcA epimerase
MRKVAIIVGARPQFIKHAPVEKALGIFFDVFSIHTGQHYDSKMSDIFFNELGINPPRFNLSIGSGSHGLQTGKMMIELERILEENRPDAVLVYGDTNSTLAGALVASKMGVKLVHIEAGLRSFNREMPEEINRVLTDHVSSFLFAPTNLSVDNLLKEGITRGVYNVGDVMCDAVLLAKKKIESSGKLERTENILVTLHRPYNTDDISRLLRIIESLNGLKEKIIFPLHPRTKNSLLMNEVDLSNYKNIRFIDPVSYFDLIKLQLESKCVITDSGGVQKEAYILERKCITVRTETEWKETLRNGWNTLIFNDLSKLAELIERVPGEYLPNMYGEGDSARRIAEILNNEL